MSDPNLSVQRQIQALEDRLERLRKADVPGVAGTWTPTLVGATIAGTFVYNAVTSGAWTRLADTIFFRGRLTITTVSVAPTGALRIGGLPSNGATVTAGFAGGSQFSFWSLFGLGGGANTYLAGAIASGNNFIDLYESVNNNGFTTQVTGAIAAVAANTDLLFQGQYQI